MAGKSMTSALWDRSTLGKIEKRAEDVAQAPEKALWLGSLSTAGLLALIMLGIALFTRSEGGIGGIIAFGIVGSAFAFSMGLSIMNFLGLSALRKDLLGLLDAIPALIETAMDSTEQTAPLSDRAAIEKALIMEALFSLVFPVVLAVLRKHSLGTWILSLILGGMQKKIKPMVEAELSKSLSRDSTVTAEGIPPHGEEASRPSTLIRVSASISKIQHSFSDSLDRAIHRSRRRLLWRTIFAFGSLMSIYLFLIR